MKFTTMWKTLLYVEAILKTRLRDQVIEIEKLRFFHVLEHTSTRLKVDYLDSEIFSNYTDFFGLGEFQRTFWSFRIIEMLND